MLLHVAPNQVERGASSFDASEVAEFKSGTFGIADPIMAMQVFRGSIYKNKPRIICQEMMSNGRDAHRELAEITGDPAAALRPLDVTLPTHVEPVIVFRDYGVGISPSRIESVVLDYFSSTKRKSNTQTGAFGLGAKTPFSYTDTFSITTFIPDDKGLMLRREYLAYIEESGAGAIELVKSAEPTDEPRGTRISFAVAAVDVSRFRREATSVVRFWSEKPNFFGLDTHETTPQPPAKKLYGDGWFVSSDSSDSYPHIILDGVIYPISFSDIKGLPTNLIHLADVPLFLTFSTGDGIMPAATREFLDYNQMTSETLVSKLMRVNTEIQRIIRNHLSSCSSHMEASLVFHKKWKKLWGSGAYPFYRGVSLVDVQSEIKGLKLTSYSKKTKHRRGLGSILSVSNCRSWINPTILDVLELASSDSREYVPVENDSTSDTGRVNTNRLRGWFQSNPDKEYHRILVVSFTSYREKEVEESRRLTESIFGVGRVGKVSDLPTFKKPKAPKKARILAAQPVRIFKGIATPLKEGEELPGGGIYVLQKRGDLLVTSTQAPYTSGELYPILSQYSTPIHKVSFKFAKKFAADPRWISVEEWLQKRLQRELVWGKNVVSIEAGSMASYEVDYAKKLARKAHGTPLADALLRVSPTSAVNHFLRVKRLCAFVGVACPFHRTFIDLPALLSDYPLLNEMYLHRDEFDVSLMVEYIYQQEFLKSFSPAQISLLRKISKKK